MTRGGRLRALAAAAAVVGPLLLVAAPAGAAVDKAGADLTGCKGTATSTDKSGGTVDTVAAPGPPGSSQDNPFHVDTDGSVHYDGSSDTVIKNHHWSVKVFGSTVKSGGSKNEDGKTTSSDTVKISDYLKVKITGLFYVSGHISGDNNASCDGNMWVKVGDSPVGTVAWFGGLGFVVIGGALLFFALPTGAAAAGSVGAGSAGAGAAAGSADAGGRFSGGGGGLGEPPPGPPAGGGGVEA
jgi:hypothetical protein